MMGKVAAVGDNVTACNVGDRIGTGYHGGHTGDRAQFAEFCILRAKAAAYVLDKVDAAMYAPLLCAGATIFAPEHAAAIVTFFERIKNIKLASLDFYSDQLSDNATASI
ncbi:hypothetical protein F4779DRAFT_616526 [Xylariaceae sp. FL0662B]|nr:hypothetical protein F4779DRAFT_616526 [Xylariaceae sp. FL0662B]